MGLLTPLNSDGGMLRGLRMDRHSLAMTLGSSVARGRVEDLVTLSQIPWPGISGTVSVRYNGHSTDLCYKVHVQCVYIEIKIKVF